MHKAHAKTMAEDSPSARIASACRLSPADEGIYSPPEEDVFVTPDRIKMGQIPARWEIWAKWGIVGITAVIILSAVATGFLV